MTETHNAIAGVPPYERGFHAMGYLEEVPPLRIITDELMVVSTLKELPQVLTREETYIYIPASLLLENSTQQDFIRELPFNDKLRILVDSPANSFEMCSSANCALLPKYLSAAGYILSPIISMLS